MRFLCRDSPETGSSNSSHLNIPDLLPVAALKAKLRVLSHTRAMSISAQGQVCIENLAAVLHYSVFPQEDKYSPLNREETLMVIFHCWLQDGLGAE